LVFKQFGELIEQFSGRSPRADCRYGEQSASQGDVEDAARFGLAAACSGSSSILTTT
jgi:hypothetical protein